MPHQSSKFVGRRTTQDSPPRRLVDAAVLAVQSHQMADKGDHAAFEQDVEDLARRLFRLDSAAGAGVFLLLSAASRSDFVKTWDEADDSTKQTYRQQARQVVDSRHDETR